MARGLSLDPGATRMGWAVLEPGPTYIASGLLGLPRPFKLVKGKKVKSPFQLHKLSVEEMFTATGNKLFDLYDPDYLVNEILPALGSYAKASTDNELAKASLTVMHTLAFERGIPVHQIAANTVKLRIGGSKDATKVKVRNGVIKALPELAPRIKDWTKIFDEPDGIAVGLAHMNVKV